MVRTAHPLRSTVEKYGWQSSGPLYGRLTIRWREHSVYSRKTGTITPLSQLSSWKVTGNKFPDRIPLLMTGKPWWVQTSDACTNPEVLPHPYRENNTWQMKWRGEGELCQGHNYLQEITQKRTKVLCTLMTLPTFLTINSSAYLRKWQPHQNLPISTNWLRGQWNK